MLHSRDGGRRATKRPSQASSFERWLERTQRRAAKTHGSGVEYRSYMNDSCHIDPQGSARASLTRCRSRTPLPWSPVPYSVSTPGQPSRVEDLEGLLLMQGHYNHLLPSATVREEIDCSHTSTRPMAPASCTRDLPPSTAASLYAYGGVGDALCNNVNTIVTDDGRSFVVGSLLSLNAHRPQTQELMGGCALPSGATDAAGVICAAEAEAERYIARLEEEVQMLMMEVSDKDRCILLMSAAKAAMEVQLQEQMRRGDLISDESATRQMLSYSFMRTVAFYKTQEESNRTLELSTQISVLKSELKFAEAMLAQSQTSATTAASQHQLQLLEEKRNENELVHSFSTTLRSLLQGEYDRLAQLVSEMPNKVQMIMSKKDSTSHGEGDHVARDATAPQRRQLYELVESVLAARVGATVLPVDAASSTATYASASISSPSPTPLKGADASHLVGLVSRVCDHHAAMTELYCAEADRKAVLLQYEGDVVRLINAKQSSLTWATLYEEKKDEVKYLKEKIISLLDARGQSTPVVCRGPSAGSGEGSAIRTQIYEAYAAPYVPSSAKVRTPSRDTPGGSSMSQEVKRQRSPAIRKPVGVLREEALRLGAVPASYYRPTITCASRSMSSLAAPSNPAHVEQRSITQKHDASGKRSGSEEAAAASAVVEVLAVVSSSSHACSPVVSVNQASPRPVESGGTSPSALSPQVAQISEDKEERPAVQSQPHRRDSRQQAEATGQLSMSRTALSNSLSSSSTSEMLPLSRSLNVAKLKRVFAAQEASSSDSSSSVSSISLLSHTKPQSASAKPMAAPAKQRSQRKTVHNSFDDTDDNASEADAATGPESSFNAPHRSLASQVAQTGAQAKAVLPGKTLTSTAATSKNSKKQRSRVESEDDTSSANISMKPRFVIPVMATPSGVSTSAHASEGKGTGATAVAKLSHMRRSSFDEDDEDDGGKDSSSSSSSSASAAPVPAPHAKVGSSTARASTAAKKLPGERRSMPDTTSPATSRFGDATSNAISGKQTKLKLPTW